MVKEMSLEKYDFQEIIIDPNKKLILIIYDIVDNKRRNMMVKVLESYGKRVQKSAFEALLTKNKYQEILERITKVVEQEDNIRIYRLNSSNEVLLLGNSESIYEEDLIIC